MSRQVEHTIDVNALRRSACATLAEGMKSGAFGFQFRFIRHEGVPVEAWIYEFHTHEWRKRDDFALTGDAATELYHEIEMISKRDYADDWMCRRTDHSDRTDFELKFHRHAVEAHLNGDLQSFLIGCLFYGHHDSGKDARHRIRFQGH